MKRVLAAALVLALTLGLELVPSTARPASAAAPVVTSVSPRQGSVSGGNSVAVSGSGFTGATAVTFGGTPATGINVNSDSSITATAPAHAAGLIDVQVTTPGGTSAAVRPADQYTYYAVLVDSVAPRQGPTAGGTTITITGSGFSGASTVSVGGNPATNVQFLSATQLKADTPAGTAGLTDVRVTTGADTSPIQTAQDQYTYYAVLVDSVTPRQGSTAGGTTITITGSGFTGASTVSVGGNPATNVQFLSATQLKADTPPGTAGLTDVRVTTGADTSPVMRPQDQFTYLSATVTNTPTNTPTPTNTRTPTNTSTPTRTPTATPGAARVQSVSPRFGSTDGGTVIAIVGTGFTGVSQVLVGGVAASSFTFNSDTSITATTPPGAPGVVDVQVVVGGAPSPAVRPADQFTYYAVLVTNVSPRQGPTTGGTALIISGSGFTPASIVSLGGNAALNVQFVSPTQLRASAPAGFAGLTDLRVTTGSQTSPTMRPQDEFTYQAAPPPPLLYGATGAGAPSTLFRIDPNTGIPDPVGPVRVGNIPIGITGLAVHPITRVLYGSTTNQGPFTRSLVTIDRGSGVATVVGGYGFGSGTLQDITFRADGTLFGFNGNIGAAGTLYTVNTATGATTAVGSPTGMNNSTGRGLSFLPLLGGPSQLFITPDCDCGNMYTLDPATGALASTIPLIGGIGGFSINALTTDAAGTALLGSRVGGGGFPADLVAIDPTSGVLTSRSSLPDGMDALALELPVPPPAPGPVLYAATGSTGVSSTLYRVDPTNGASVPIGPVLLDGMGVGLTGLAVHPVTRVLYGATTSGGQNPNAQLHLITINKATGAATDVGSFSICGCGAMQDVSFRADGTLFGFNGNDAPSGTLYTIDLATGLATAVGSPTGMNNTRGRGLSFLPLTATNAPLYITPDGDAGHLYTLNPATGALLTTTALHGTLGLAINALTTDAAGTTLLGVGATTTNPSQSTLLAINPSTGAITTRGPLPVNVDGLALD